MQKNVRRVLAKNMFRPVCDAPSSAFGTFSPTKSVGEKALD
jgi:hypothetical protein